jgi:hypothetical protein
MQPLATDAASGVAVTVAVPVPFAFTEYVPVSVAWQEMPPMLSVSSPEVMLPFPSAVTTPLPASGELTAVPEIPNADPPLILAFVNPAACTTGGVTTGVPLPALELPPPQPIRKKALRRRARDFMGFLQRAILLAHNGKVQYL